MKRSKTPLALIELLIMIFIFALAAAICLRVFVYSYIDSKNLEQQDQAITIAASIAGALQTQDAQALEFYNLAPGVYENIKNGQSGAYRFALEYCNQDDYIWSAVIYILNADNDLIFELPVSGQKEVTAYAGP